MRTADAGRRAGLRPARTIPGFFGNGPGARGLRIQKPDPLFIEAVRP